MLSSILPSSTNTLSVSLPVLLTTIFASLLAGFVIAKIHMYRNHYSKNFVFTIALLPVLVSAVIMVVNGNLGAGITVAGAFTLVRFRSAPGNAREITTIFFSMASGLAIGMGYVVYAFIFVIIVSLAMLAYTQMKFGETASTQKQVKITLPEYTDYNSEFNPIFAEFTNGYKIEQVKTTNLGSLLEVTFSITEKDSAQQKIFLDKLREVNGNLPITIQHNKLGLNDL
ncbi:DUF4956 domain-containing protein [Pseudolactococcus reticulitermitis]|uniref:DUF4956 domain-containing protein n=1 Tax=Pseudolactococcus reticulitermitis TaxID=2025039 RepID=A0A224XDZ6_9LACT|nr:DUF4956 domain-containing protein [Lactococcus reticulitermitis]GAX47813.1 hypothetical protein RsY01_1417 [Lactococcus reticulitermitis]